MGTSRRRNEGAAEANDRPLTFPTHYDETYVALVEVAPAQVFAHWEVDGAEWDLTQHLLGNRGRLVLRLYDVTFIVFDGANAHGHFDIEVHPAVGSWHIYTPSDGRSYIADIGLGDPLGRFVALARSNCVQMPRAGEVAERHVEWLCVEGDPRQRRRALDEHAAPVGLPPSASPEHVDPEGLSHDVIMAQVSRQDVVRFYRRLCGLA